MNADFAASCLPRFVLHRLAAGDPPSAPERERGEAAVLFADLSGFTARAEELARRGPDGAEMLAGLLDAAFAPLAETIGAHGGDLIKFIGDAVIAIWPGDGSGLAAALAQATHCAAAMRQRHPAGGFALHAGIGAGEISTMLLGGDGRRWYSTLAGPGLRQATDAARQAGDSEVVLAGPAWRTLAGQFAGTPLADGFVRLGTVHAVPGALSGPQPAAAVPAARLRPFLPEVLRDIAGPDALAWLAELRPASVLFVGLDALPEHTDELLPRVDALLTTTQGLIRHFDGWLKEFTFDDKGCTIVALFGTPPFAHEDDAARALRAAMALHAALSRDGQPCSIGIASGHVLCGLVGSPGRRDYAVVGATMNRAARLMQAAAGGLICDQASMHAARGAVRCLPLAARRLKGIDEAIATFRPVHRQESAGPGTATVGREPERASIAAAIRDTKDGAAVVTRILVIEGEPGIGKSQLLGTTPADGFVVLRAAGDPVDNTTPYAALRSLLRPLFGAALDEPGNEDEPKDADTTARDALRARVSSALAEAAHLAPLLNAVLPLGWPDSAETAAMDGAVRAANTRRLLLRLIDHECGERPRLLLIDDAQWLDGASWGVLAALAGQARRQLLILAARPAVAAPPEYQALLAHPATRRLALHPLTDDETSRLLARCLDAGSVQPPIVAFVGERSGGHPLFVEYLAQALLDSGLIVLEHGECRLRRADADLAGLPFPDTVQGIARARIDRLHADQQLTLKVASVLGRHFSLAALAAIHPLRPAPAVLGEQLAALNRLGLLAAAAATSYGFPQAIIRQAAYDLLLFGQRRELHRAAAAFGACAEEAGADSPARLAHHYSLAIDPAAPDPALVAAAARYCAAAGARALHVGACREAARLLDQALAWENMAGGATPKVAVADRPRLATLHRQLGDARSGLGELAAAQIHHQQALHLLGNAHTAAIGGLLAASAVQLTHRLWPRYLLGRRRAQRERLLETVRACERLAEIAFFHNQPLPSLRWSLLGLNAAEAAGTSPELARISASMAVTGGLVGLHRLARTYERQAQAVAGAVDELASTAWTQMASSLYRIGIGDWACAQRAADAAIDLYARLGHQRYWEASAYLKLMILAHHEGRAEDCARLAADIEASGARSGNVQAESWGLLGQAESALRQHRADAAHDWLTRAERLLPRGIGRAEEIRVYALLAATHLERGAADQAAHCLGAALDGIRAAAATTYYSLEAYATAALAALALERQRHPASTALANDACAALRTFARTFPIARPRALLIDGARHWRHASTRASGLWQRALAEAETLRMPYETALIHATLGEHLADARGERHRTRARELFAALGAAYPPPAGRLPVPTR